MSNWISVEDRLPEIGSSVLVSDESGYTLATFEGADEEGSGQLVWDERFNMDVTHWMPLPEPPKNSN